jgi:hypothetical protein
MVDKKLNFLSRNSKYAVIEIDNTNRPNTIGKIIYSNGEPLEYGDIAEIFSVLNLEEEFIPFIKSALSETYFTKEHYGFIFGYQPASFDDDEIKENEVKIHYAGVDNTILKKEFFELCILLCEAKLVNPNKGVVTDEELLQIKSQLEEKLKIYGI